MSTQGIMELIKKKIEKWQRNKKTLMYTQGIRE